MIEFVYTLTANYLMERYPEDFPTDVIANKFLAHVSAYLSCEFDTILNKAIKAHAEDNWLNPLGDQDNAD